jgi:hypothetical protein
LLVWANRPAAEASWIDDEEFKSLYPDFQLEDELLEKGGGRDVMLDVQYTMRCGKRQAEIGAAMLEWEISDLE